MAHRLATLVLKQHKKNENATQPFGFVVGGETTVTLDMSNPGKGGRSQELALAFALNMWDADLLAPQRWAIIAAGTDGRDGPTDAAGGFLHQNKGSIGAPRKLLSQRILVMITFARMINYLRLELLGLILQI